MIRIVRTEKYQSRDTSLSQPPPISRPAAGVSFNHSQDDNHHEATRTPKLNFLHFDGECNPLPWINK